MPPCRAWAWASMIWSRRQLLRQHHPIGVAPFAVVLIGHPIQRLDADGASLGTLAPLVGATVARILVGGLTTPLVEVLEARVAERCVDRAADAEPVEVVDVGRDDAERAPYLQFCVLRRLQILGVGREAASGVLHPHREYLGRRRGLLLRQGPG